MVLDTDFTTYAPSHPPSRPPLLSFSLFFSQMNFFHHEHQHSGIMGLFPPLPTIFQVYLDRLSPCLGDLLRIVILIICRFGDNLHSLYTVVAQKMHDREDMKKQSLNKLAVCSILLSTSLYAEEPSTKQIPAKTPTISSALEAQSEANIQIALLLDTSSSMDGLIDQARTQLWKVVNSFSTVNQNGAPPRIEVALYEYGNDSLSMLSGYIRQVSPFTSELDTISEKLFALKTNGGSEYCGTVIKKALNSLEWNDSPMTYKAIFIAGNEPFTQGLVPAQKQCQQAALSGIIVNTIHCGNHQTGISGGWQAGALSGHGEYLNIDQDQTIAHIVAPQDKLIIELSARLNTTYIPYGQQGATKWKNQAIQDANSMRNQAKGAAVNRALTKGSHVYSNISWDLLDLCEATPDALQKIAPKDLPKEMQNLSLAEKQAFIDTKAKERKALQSQIATLNKEREKFLKQERMKNTQAQKEDSLDSALTKTIHKQITRNGFSNN